MISAFLSRNVKVIDVICSNSHHYKRFEADWLLRPGAKICFTITLILKKQFLNTVGTRDSDFGYSKCFTVRIWNWKLKFIAQLSWQWGWVRRGNINNKCHPSQLTSNGQTFCGGGCKYKYKYKNKQRYNTRILYGCKSLSPVFLSLKGCTSASGQYSQFLLSLTLRYQVSGGRADLTVN